MCIAILVLSGCATLPEHYVSLHDRRVLRLDETLQQIKDERVIFVGESHESEDDHLVQFEIIKHLHENRKRVVIALEMFPADMQPILTQWVKGALSEDDFEKAYNRAWRVYYEEIFKYSKEAHIPLVGINANSAQIRSVAQRGLAAVPEEIRRMVGVSSCAELPDYEKMIRLIEPNISHAANLPFMCDAQLLRDTIMAHNIAGILK